MSQTDKLIAELSELFADNSYSKEFIKERLDNLALIAPLGAVGLIEPENYKPTEENEQN
jgi:hypothetical protein